MRDFVCTWRGEWPKTSMWPLVGLRRPRSSLTVVDLPEPFGPSRPNTSPFRTSKSTLSTARALGRFQKSLNTFVSPRTDTTTSADFSFPVCDGEFGSVKVISHLLVFEKWPQGRILSSAFRQWQSSRRKSTLHQPAASRRCPSKTSTPPQLPCAYCRQDKLRFGDMKGVTRRDVEHVAASVKISVPRSSQSRLKQPAITNTCAAAKQNQRISVELF